MAAYAGLLVLALSVLVAESRRSLGALRRGRHALILWTAAATFLAGVTQRDLWPLSSWSLMTGAPRRDMGVQPPYLRIALLDAAGREYPLDYRAVEPLPIEELMAWMRINFFALSSAQRDSVARYLLSRADAARARVAAGGVPGTQGRWLGALRAPFHTLHPRQWTGPDRVPDAPFAGLRVYGETWDLEQRARDSSRVARTVRYQYPVSP
jgi:hypothetical protein